jgi:hypothetical protein
MVYHESGIKRRCPSLITTINEEILIQRQCQINGKIYFPEFFYKITQRF